MKQHDTSKEAGRRERDFPLARYFIVFSLVAMGAATTLVTWFTLSEVRAELTANASGYAAEIVNNLFHQIENEYLGPLVERGETYDHSDPQQVEELAAVVTRSIYAHHVRKLYFFDVEGLIVFSTQREHIGHKVPDENTQFRIALGGTVSWVLKRRNDPLDISGSPTAEELLETYVPVYSRLGGDPEQAVGVIEIYQSVDELQAELRKTRDRIVTISVCSLTALFLVFVYFIRRADGIVRQRRRDLVRSNRALHELSQRLEALVEERTQQLLEKQKLASLGGLAAGLAHEINTPLATITACSEGSVARLKELLDDSSDAAKEVFHYLDLIEGEAFRCKKITNSLLDYSRQRPVLEVESIDLNALVEQTLVLLRVNKENRRIDFETILDADLPEARGDPAQVRQVIHNLVENAVHAVGDNVEARVVLRTTFDDDWIEFSCEDNGAGVPSEIRGKIFEPFFTTKPSKKGVGLGLALSFSIAERHGGRLSFASADTGSVFRLSLSRHETAERTE